VPTNQHTADYDSFLQSKRFTAHSVGFEPQQISGKLFDFQRDIVRWAVKRGRAALLEDCGLGKTPQQLEWAREVYAHTNKPVLISAPLAVSQQTVREGAKFDVPVHICHQQSDVRRGVNITNYEKIHNFPDASAFGGIVLDESSILKGYDGKFRRHVTDYAKAIPYRLAATATAAPNDFMELGTHSEFLDVMNLNEMLATFFIHDGGDTAKWRLKGHAEDRFWRWVASWAVCIRKPSDLGYADEGFKLPPLHMHQDTVQCDASSGFLFPMEGQTLQERQTARRDSIGPRVARCAEIVNASDQQWLVWCNLNAESEALTKSISGAIEVSGSDTAEFKERALLEFIDGKRRVLVSKPRIFGFGINAQQCSHMAFVGLSDSYEQLYQAIRRCWRFGQTKPVHCHLICAETEGAVVRNIERKERQATKMFEGMVDHMKAISAEEIRGSERDMDEYNPSVPMEVPAWL
jgi:hypothetical protein